MPASAYSSHICTQADTVQALKECCQVVREGLGNRPASLVALFASPHHHEMFDRLPSMVRERLECAHLIGCTGESIVGRQQEVEEAPALSVWAAHAPDLVVRPFHVQFEQRDSEIALHGWPDLAVPGNTPSAVLLLPEPFSSVPQLLLDQFQLQLPESPLIGGVASGAMRPGANRLFLGSESHERGAVGMLLSGPVEIRTLVSQGCRPIGRHLVITSASQNVIHQLSGKPAFGQLQELYQQMAESDQALARNALHIGCVVNEYQAEFQRGDFLLRNIMGIDQEAGSIAISDRVRIGQTVQFHVRDAQSASEDLQTLLARESDAAGALLFSCNGRGTRLFGRAHHDAAQINDALGDIPLAGFFAQGEIGPVGQKSFLHGYTASIALFG